MAREELDRDEEVSDPVGDDLAAFIAKVFSSKSKEAKLKEKAGQYLYPNNCLTLTVPMTNPEIWAILKSYVKKTDTKVTSIQRYVAKGATAVLKCVDKMAGRGNDEMKELLDGLTFLGHAFQCLSMHRRDLQKYALPSDIRGICDLSESCQPPSDLLYGNEVKRLMKEAREQNRFSMSSKRDYKRRPLSRNGRYFLGERRFPSRWGSQSQRRHAPGSSQNKRKKQTSLH